MQSQLHIDIHIHDTYDNLIRFVHVLQYIIVRYILIVILFSLLLFEFFNNSTVLSSNQAHLIKLAKKLDILNECTRTH